VPAFFAWGAVKYLVGAKRAPFSRSSTALHDRDTGDANLNAPQLRSGAYLHPGPAFFLPVRQYASLPVASCAFGLDAKTLNSTSPNIQRHRSSVNTPSAPRSGPPPPLSLGGSPSSARVALRRRAGAHLHSQSAPCAPTDAPQAARKFFWRWMFSADTPTTLPDTALPTRRENQTLRDPGTTTSPLGQRLWSFSGLQSWFRARLKAETPDTKLWVLKIVDGGHRQAAICMGRGLKSGGGGGGLTGSRGNNKAVRRCSGCGLRAFCGAVGGGRECGGRGSRRYRILLEGPPPPPPPPPWGDPTTPHNNTPTPPPTTPPHPPHPPPPNQLRQSPRHGYVLLSFYFQIKVDCLNGRCAGGQGGFGSWRGALSGSGVFAWLI